MKRLDLVGNKYGRLLVINKAEPLKGHTRWLCKCDCGNECIVYSTSLKTGNTTSCGCFKKENARKLYSSVRQNNKDLYAVWNGIKQRCTNRNNKSYHNYGGRGIKMDEKWAGNYETFYRWAMHSGYQKGKQIDRIDNDGDYCESNCRFVDIEIQANNKRNVTLYTINEETKSLAQWCREYNQDYKFVYQRIHKLGWNILDALTTPRQDPKEARKERKQR